MRLRGSAAAVSGARHLRIGRNGQDAAASWVAGREPGDLGAVVVCDGCGSGASSEVGARLGAQLVLGAITRQLEERGAVERGALDHTVMWDRVRADVVRSLETLVRSMPGAREQIVHDHFLFTTIAAVMVGDEIAVWAIGDGAYAIDGRVRELGPFENNQPPYLAYDLLGEPQVAHLEIARGSSVIVATDGVAEIGLDLLAGGDRAPHSLQESCALDVRRPCDRFVAHPDALRRQLAIMARSSERVDWDARRVVRTPALLQDDGAVAMLVRDAGGVS